MAPVLDETPRDTPDIVQGSRRSSREPTITVQKPKAPQESLTKRLQSELMSLMLSNSTGISAFPNSDSDLTKWTGTIKGPEATPYENMTFKLSFDFSANYPFEAPTVLFTTPIYHPNIDFSGRICLDILKDRWSAVQNVQSVLISLQSLLAEPNNSSPLNGEAAELWDRDMELFKRKVLARHKEPCSV